MPIDYKEYPKNWKQLREKIMFRARGRCELCDALNYEPHWKTKSKVVLTIHHIDRNKKNNNLINLIALCQRCHLRLDLEGHIAKRNKTKKFDF